MYVIVETDWDSPGEDAVLRVFGPYVSEEEAMVMVREWREDDLAGYSRLEDCAIGYCIVPMRDAK